MPLMETFHADGDLWLVGHGWCVNKRTGRSFRGDRHTISPARTHKQEVEISPHEIEALELGLNARERAVYVRLRGEGKQVLRAGWPDLLVIDGDEVYGLEVKSPQDKVSTTQGEMHKALEKAGLRVEIERVK